MYSFLTLAGPHSIAVQDHAPATVRRALAHHFNVTTDRIVIHATDPPLVVVQAPYEIEHDPLAPDYRVPQSLLEFLETYPLETLSESARKVMSSNAGLTEFLFRHPDLIDFDGLVLNPHPYAVEYAAAYRSHAEHAADNQGAIGQIADALAQHVCSPEGCTGPKIAWRVLSTNPRAVHLLRAFPNHVQWAYLGLNPSAEAVEMLAERPDQNWNFLSQNTHPRAIELLRAHPERISWSLLSANPSAIDILLENVDKIVWLCLCRNTHPKAVELLIQNPKRIEWHTFSRNRTAIDYLTQHLDKAYWDQLSQNPFAGALLEKYPEKIVHYMLTVNLTAFDVMRKYPDRLWIADVLRPRAWFERV